MQRLKYQKLIILSLGIFTPLTIMISKVNASTFGAEIFCTMRDGGNDHESSWEAAYTYIKQQKGGIFKVSPKRAASQITETVIRESEKVSYCVDYLEYLRPNHILLLFLELLRPDNMNKINYISVWVLILDSQFSFLLAHTYPESS